MKFNFLNKTWSFTLLILVSFVGLSSIWIDKAALHQEQLNQNIVTKSVSTNNLKDDIENLSMSVDVINRTISYDIEFKTNDFNGTQVSSYFFQMDPDATFYGSEEWIPTKFNNSAETVQNKKASNTTSYSQIDDFDEYQMVAPSGLSAALSVSYLKDGIEQGATLEPIYLNLDYFDRMFVVEDDQSTLTYNDDKTVANIGFNVSAADEITIDKINLKSHSDADLNQNIFDKDNSALLLQGNNNKPLVLLSEYHYYDLYLEFTFSNYQGGLYIYESDIVGVDFTSGYIETGGLDLVSLIVMLFIILLVILMIIIIILIVRQMKKRKELEKQQNQAYYDENYEDGMN